MMLDVGMLSGLRSLPNLPNFLSVSLRLMRTCDRRLGTLRLALKCNKGLSKNLLRIEQNIFKFYIRLYVEFRTALFLEKLYLPRATYQKRGYPCSALCLSI